MARCKIKVNNSIVAPPGAGANFLTNLTVGKHFKNNVNEHFVDYSSDTSLVWNDIDQSVENIYLRTTKDEFQFQLNRKITDWDKFQTVNKNFLDFKNRHIDTLYCHVPPYVLSLCSSFTCDNQLGIVLSKDSWFFVRFLEYYKKYIGTTVYERMQNNPGNIELVIFLINHYIDDLLNTIDWHKLSLDHFVKDKLPNRSLDYLFRNLSPETLSLLNPGSVFSLEFLMYCHNRKIEITDKQLNYFILSRLTQLKSIYVKSKHNLWPHKDYKNLSYTYFLNTTNKKCYKNGVTITYEDLFFKRILPDYKIFKKKGVYQSIKEYSLENLILVETFCKNNKSTISNELLNICNKFRSWIN